MRKHSLMLLAAATIGLAATQASAADLPRKAPQQHRRRRRRQLPGPDVTSARTSAGYLAKVMRLSILWKSLETILALLAAVRLAAIINSPADG
jgi:hypothetical protein